MIREFLTSNFRLYKNNDEARSNFSRKSKDSKKDDKRTSVKRASVTEISDKTGTFAGGERDSMMDRESIGRNNIDLDT
jgi:hypothetical protein